MIAPSLLALLACAAPADRYGGGGTSLAPELGGDSGGESGGPTALVFEGPRPRNVLMISWDTTRRDGLIRYGGTEAMDRIDALFANGVALDDHRSCSNWTWASVVCVQNAMYDDELGYIATSDPDYMVEAPEELLLASEVMRDLGYQTGLVTTNNWFSADINMNQGFELNAYKWGGKADWTAESAWAFFEDELDPERPWYIHVHFMDPHIPYTPPEGYREGYESLEPLEGYDLGSKPDYWELEEDWDSLDAETQALALAHLEARYAGELAYADDMSGWLLDALELGGWLDDTLIVAWTDHGEQLLEHGKVGHAEDLYEPENRSMAAFVAPGLVPVSWSGPTTHADIWPTVFDALGLPAPSRWTGQVVGARPDDDIIFGLRHDGEKDRIIQFAERRELKLVYEWDGTKELYRVDEDPLEHEDLYDPEDPEVIALWEALLPRVQAVWEAMPDWTPVDPGP